MSQQGLCGLTNPFSPVKAVSGAISEWSATQFSLTFSESTGAVGAEDSLCHLWKQFRRLFLSGQRLNFP
jgi:hypothetical protein